MPGDDYAAIYQALVRRYSRVKANEGVLPDVILIDGGAGQLQKAIEAMEEVQITGLTLVGVAKGPDRKPGMEQLLIAGRAHPLQLKEDSVALHLIQFIRDEAHRFAIAAHRGQRAKKRSQSPLENIEGVGAKRRQALLKYFGGWQELSRASMAEIAKVPGVSAALAEKIYAALH